MNGGQPREFRMAGSRFIIAVACKIAAARGGSSVPPDNRGRVRRGEMPVTEVCSAGDGDRRRSR
jgi:hypothetical protein